MSNLDNITKKIRSDAEAEAAAVLAQAEETAQQVLAAARKDAEVEAAACLNRAKEQARLTRERLQAGVELKARDLVLAARQRVIDRIFELAERQLAVLPDAVYAERLSDYLAQHPLGAGSRLLLPPGRVQLSTAVPADADPNLRAGFKVITGGVVENRDYIELLNYLRDDLTADVAARLKQVAYEA